MRTKQLERLMTTKTSNAAPSAASNKFKTNMQPIKNDGSGSPAQTASVGDREMMTYMNFPNPSPTVLDSNVTTQSNTDSDDARFLDGLFERTSGSSDSGSDKGGDDSSGGGNPSSSSGGNKYSTRKYTNGPIAAVSAATSLSNFGPVHTQNVMNPNNSSDISSLTTSSHTNAPIAAQLPQHLLNANAFHLPPNLLSQAQPAQAAVTSNNLDVNAAAATPAQQPVQQPVQQQSLVNNLGNAIPNLSLGQLNWLMSSAAQQQPVNLQTVTAQAAVAATAFQQLQQQQQAQQLQQQAQQQQVVQAQQLQQQTQQRQAQFAVPQVQSQQLFQDPSSITPIAPVSAPAAAPAVAVSVTKPSRPKKSRKKTKDSTAPCPRTTIQGDHISSISEDEGDAEKRRKDRNRREQNRSQLISKQIADLRNLLAKSNVSFKSDKYSTLVSVHQYIKTLQERAALLDEEHRKLVDTITKSDDLVNKSINGHNSCPSSSSSDAELKMSANGSMVIPSNAVKTEEDELLVFVRGLDYKSVFAKVRIALCVTAIDGRLLDCNDEFVRICGLNRDTLIRAGMRQPDENNENEMASAGKSPMSLFNLMAREDMQKVYEAMSSMLRRANFENAANNRESGDGGIIQLHSNSKSDHWSSEISHCYNSSIKLQLNISLVRYNSGNARFFNCALTPI
ncbi:hypothetical protein CTEN210_00725 [Chaetoceros tenuissimus]|uniref:BHLH domain-containing protein n=1 Tax=Chaetoceros tenuissimus TaxID=426638 RepID=A0AAD3GYZ2_9STRA|nr:hypothetical protein CTEN210_00725 [Chaetoceros tenuissimus]